MVEINKKEFYENYGRGWKKMCGVLCDANDKFEIDYLKAWAALTSMELDGDVVEMLAYKYAVDNIE